MGLDMYLKRTLHISDYSWQGSKDHRLKKTLKAAGYDGPVADQCRTAELAVTVAYWRKANAIHRWFVENVQGGEDDCREAHVSQATLRRLLETVRHALTVAEVETGQPVVHGYTLVDGEWTANIEQGRAAMNGAELEEVLPTQAGFFFGSTAYDEWYLRDLQDTVVMLEAILNDPELGEHDSFTYTSSW